MVFIKECKNSGGLKKVIKCNFNCKCILKPGNENKLIKKHNMNINNLEACQNLFDDHIYQNILKCYPKKITKKDIIVGYIPCDECQECRTFYSLHKKFPNISVNKFSTIYQISKSYLHQ